LLACALSASQPSLGRDDAPAGYGKRYIAADAPALEPLPPRVSAPESEAWEARILAAQYRNGPYDPGLSETLQDAGNYFYNHGDITSAIDHWRRAVHLTRVNDGLNTRLQLPLLERLLETYLKVGDYAAADRIQSYLYHLRRRHSQPGDEARVEAYVAWVDWQREQWLRAPTPAKPKPLLELHRELSLASRDEAEAPLSAAQMEPLIYAYVELLYVVRDTDFGLDIETDMRVSSSTDPFTDAGEINLEQARMLQDSAYRRGVSRLKRLVRKMGSEGDRVGKARAHLALGDWYTWYDRAFQAAENYRASWNLLSKAVEPGLQQAWFGQPVALPDSDALSTGPATAEVFRQSAVVVVQFTVTERGEVRDIETSAGDPRHANSAYRLGRMLSDSRFRPRLEAGEPVRTEGIVREFRVSPR
jgi:hypothetical protein